jgi:NADH:ubiquinone oxidoreductase subunit D
LASLFSVKQEQPPDHPFGLFRSARISVALAESGDVMARALLRWLETQHSLAFLRAQLEEIPDGLLGNGTGFFARESLARIIHA